MVTMQDQTRNESAIRVIRPEELSEDTVQTSGSHGLAAIASELATFLRCGRLFTASAGGQTAIHHHGKQDTVVCVLAGAVLIRRGRRGEFPQPPGQEVSYTSWLISRKRRSIFPIMQSLAGW